MFLLFSFKMYVPGANFINVSTCSFYVHSSQRRKKLLNLTVFFALLGSARVKAARKMLVKLTPRFLSIEFLSEKNYLSKINLLLANFSLIKIGRAFS